MLQLYCVKTSIKPTTNSGSNKGDIEFIKGKLEMQLNEIRKTHHKNYPNNRSSKTDNVFENLDDNNRKIIGRVSTTKDRKTKCTQDKLHNHIIDAKQSYHQKYQKSSIEYN